MSDDDTRHSGSRWEPTPASVPAKDKPAVDDQADAASREAVDDGPAAAGPDNAHADAAPFGRDDETLTDRMALAAAHHAPRPWPDLPQAVPLGSPSPSAPRRKLRRAGLLAAAAAGLLAVGGAGGYAIGHAAAGSDAAGAAGLAGAPGEYGHHRGQFGADSGFPGDQDSDGSVGHGRVGGTAPDGAGSPGTGTGSTGTGTGSTGTST